MEMFKTLIAFILVIGVLVVTHELGHFVVAKLNKMHVYQFCIGLGPKLLKYQGKETTYALCALPIGGMVDLREDENDPENKRSFSNKKPLQRLAVILAGAFMNFVLAYVLIVGIFLFEPLPTNTVGELLDNSPAVAAGVQVGDVIVGVNDNKISSWSDITNSIALSGDKEFDVTVLRNNEEVEIHINAFKDTDGNYKIGISPEFRKNSAAAFKYGFDDFKDKSTIIFDGFVKLVSGKIKGDEVSGPIGIAKEVGKVVETNSLTNLVYFTALLSINLGIFNLLPFPFLDGGRACFIIYELIVRKPVNKDKEAFVHFMGMVALVLLMVVLVFKDLAL